jgi:hypothetical protein
MRLGGIKPVPPFLGDCPSNLLSGSYGLFVLPETEHCPTGGFQKRVGISVAADVVVKLLSPPLGIRLRPGSVLRTAMPKAAVNEYGYFGADERQVSPSTCRRERPVDAESKAH